MKLRLAIAALTLSVMGGHASAAGWAACNTPNPPFFCDQPDPEVGPPGPEGPQGPAGADGRDGKDGKQGPRGHAGKDGADGKDGRDGVDGVAGRNGRDFNASQYRSMLASSTALGGLHFREVRAGELGWAAGIGGQFKGDAAFAIGINYGLTDNVGINASISRSFRGGEMSAFIGLNGKF